MSDEETITAAESQDSNRDNDLNLDSDQGENEIEVATPNNPPQTEMSGEFGLLDLED